MRTLRNRGHGASTPRWLLPWVAVIGALLCLPAAAVFATPAKGPSAPPGEGSLRPAGDPLQGWVQRFGSAGPVAYALAYSLLVAAFVPGSVLTVGAGAAFGLPIGLAVVWVGANLGAAISFFLSRTLLRRRVERWAGRDPRFTALDRAVAREGWKTVALTRLSPVFPFTVLNYAFGLTGIGAGAYLLASSVSMLPGMLLYVWIGAAGMQVAEAAAGAASWGRTAVQVVGVVATLGMTLQVARMARRALHDLEDGSEG